MKCDWGTCPKFPYAKVHDVGSGLDTMVCQEHYIATVALDFEMEVELLSWLR